MAKTPEKKPRGPDSTGISRRNVLIGAAATALVATVKTATAAHQQSFGAPSRTKAISPARRYMAAAAVLGDGRILISGGFDRPYSKDENLRAINTAVIFNPSTGEFSAAAPMKVARARHAAVALKDGRIAVIGGTSMQPTASIEVYDPGTDTWTNSQPLAQARYDHMAVTDGDTVFVIGGSSLSMMGSVEAVYPGTATIS